jgi:hypothetical protein
MGTEARKEKEKIIKGGLDTPFFMCYDISLIKR